MKDEPPPSSTASRILSGSVGSMIYVTAFAPLEVVKIRQQAAAAHSTVTSSSTLSSSSSSPRPASASSAKVLLRGRGAVVLSNGLVVPTSAFPCLVAPKCRHHQAVPLSRLFESDAHAAPSSSSSSSSSLRGLPRRPRNDGGGGGGVLSALRSIARNEGAAGLYAGLRPTLFAVVPNAAVYLSAYDEISSRLRREARRRDDDDGGRASSGADDGGRDGDIGGRHWIPFVAGASARLVSSVATAPLELVRTRQAANCPRHHHHHGGGGGNGVLGEFRLLLSASGPSGLYRGLVPMVLRDVPFSAVYFTCLEAVRSSVSSSTALGSWGARYHRDRGDRPPPVADAIEAFAGGMAAGSIATVLTTPFDVVKTRRMTAGIGPVGAGGGGGGDRDYSRGGRGGGGRRGGGGGDTLIGHMRRIVEEEGVRGGLWRGNWARMIKVAPGSAIMISSYELGKRLLEDVM